ncbi:MAG: D-aminoacyl-tRNA deacylase [Candidatus Cloacimonas sp.]|nr:D-tyrosyl-tRNA(Tyr) deacylase [Candidatus Cloacimonadota bacterium]
MKLLIQRVTEAEVLVAERSINKIGQGFLIFVGVEEEDCGVNKAPGVAKKVSEMRVFSDPNGKMNLSIKDIEGEVLLISQFTLCANLERGRRPDFIKAAPPNIAMEMYEELAKELIKLGVPTKLGSFGDTMQVKLTNDGPATFILER